MVVFFIIFQFLDFVFFDRIKQWIIFFIVLPYQRVCFLQVIQARPNYCSTTEEKILNFMVLTTILIVRR